MTNTMAMEYENEFCFRGKNEVLLFGTLSKNGTLTISGKGEMKDYYHKKTPWEDWKQFIHSLIIREGILGIGGKAFHGCGNLKNVKLPESLKTIHYGAFENCRSLEKVEIPEDKELRHVYEEDEKVLKTDQRQNRVEASGELLLRIRKEGRKKKSVVVGSRAFMNTQWAAKKWGDFWVRGNRLLEYYGERTDVILPEHIQEIGMFAFKGHPLTSVSLPEGLKKICFGAFEKTGLFEITIPESVESIEDNAFRNIGRTIHMIFESDTAKLSWDAFDISGTVFSGHLGSSARRYALQRGLRFRDMKRTVREKQLSEYVREISLGRIKDFGVYLENKLKAGYMVYCIILDECGERAKAMEVFTGRLKTDHSIPGKTESASWGRQKFLSYHKWNVENYLEITEDKVCAAEKKFLKWDEGCFMEWIHEGYRQDSDAGCIHKWYISLWEYGEDQIGEYQFLKRWLEEGYLTKTLQHISTAETEEERTEESVKEEALRRMRILKIKRSVQRAFEEKGTIYKAAYGSLEEIGPSEKELVKQWEEKTGKRVYYVMENYAWLGRLFTMLYVSKECSRWKQEKEEMKGGYVMAYCENMTDEDLSEYGYITVKNCEGAAIRVG